MASTTIETETELSAVNSILGAIGQSPVTEVDTANPETSFIYNILRDTNVDVQNEGWHFNTEKHVKYTPDSNKNILIADNVLRFDVTDGWHNYTTNVVKRDGKLYDKIDHTNEFTGDIYIDEVILYQFTDIPSVFQRYIIIKASVRAATQLVNNAQLVQLLQQQEINTRAAALEYETSQGDFSMFGFKDGENYHNSYQPYAALQR